MPSRRSFLRKRRRRTVVGSGPCASPHPDLRIAQESESNSAASLPPSIAAMRSMKGEAKAITAGERRARIEKARRLMAENHIDALMLTAISGLRSGSLKSLLTLTSYPLFFGGPERWSQMVKE